MAWMFVSVHVSVCRTITKYSYVLRACLNDHKKALTFGTSRWLLSSVKKEALIVAMFHLIVSQTVLRLDGYGLA